MNKLKAALASAVLGIGFATTASALEDKDTSTTEEITKLVNSCFDQVDPNVPSKERINTIFLIDSGAKAVPLLYSEGAVKIRLQNDFGCDL